MGLFSFLRPSTEPAPPSAATGAPEAPPKRTMCSSCVCAAERRLIGAALLVLVGVVVFPLVFDDPAAADSRGHPSLISIPGRTRCDFGGACASNGWRPPRSATRLSRPSSRHPVPKRAKRRQTSCRTNHRRNRRTSRRRKQPTKPAADKAAAKPTEKAAPSPRAQGGSEMPMRPHPGLLDGKDAPRKAEAARRDASSSRWARSVTPRRRRRCAHKVESWG